MSASSGVCSGKRRNIATILFVFNLSAVISASGKYKDPVCKDGICKYETLYGDLKYPVANENLLDVASHSLDNYHPCLHADCRCYAPFVESDLSPFKDGISKTMVDSVKKMGITYQIINGRLYRDAVCPVPKRCAGVEHYILAQVTRLRNMEFVVNIDDGPKIRRGHLPILPLFSISKSINHQDILVPSWDFWENQKTEECMTSRGRYQRYRNHLQHVNNNWPWAKKKSAAFFRGDRASADGDYIIYLSRIRPDLADAKYTASDNATSVLYRKPEEQVPIREMCQYKYLLNIRGEASNIRHRYMFLCKSLVLSIGDEWQEFFTSMLVPWAHFIPVQMPTRQHNMEMLVEFLLQNDEMARMIAEAGYDLVSSHLRARDVSCYWVVLLQRYQALLNYEVQRNYSLTEVEPCGPYEDEDYE